MNMHIQTFEEKVKQRRSQMLVHSYIYYKLGSSIVSDEIFDAWAMELVELQKGEFPMIGFYDYAFMGFDGSTGFDLPQDPWVERKALQRFTYYNQE